MAENLTIRESEPGDRPLIEALYPAAFPDEDLVALVSELLQTPPIALSLVGIIGSTLAGHVIFTPCRVTASDTSAALLGPLAVAPAWQRQGIGGAMVRAGMQKLTDSGIVQVYVLGDPAYYSRFGFLPDVGVAPPYSLPAEWEGAWQSMNLGTGERPNEGKLSVPAPWQQPALWLP